MLRFQLVQRNAGTNALALNIGSLRTDEIVIQVTISCKGFAFVLSEPISAILPGRLKEGVSRFAVTLSIVDQRSIHESGQKLQDLPFMNAVSLTDGLCGIQ